MAVEGGGTRGGEECAGGVRAQTGRAAGGNKEWRVICVDPIHIRLSLFKAC